MSARRRKEAAAFKRPASDEPAFDVLDATKIDEPRNSDETLALFALYAEPGDTLTLCSEWCRSHLSVDEPCTCTPVALVVGARA
jgi:hypothetical protein